MVLPPLHQLRWVHWVAQITSEYPAATFVTLSPVPGFRAWFTGMYVGM